MDEDLKQRCDAGAERGGGVVSTAEPIIPVHVANLWRAKKIPIGSHRPEPKEGSREAEYSLT